MLKPTIVNGAWVNLPSPAQDHAWLSRHTSPDRYTLQRDGEEYDLSLDYQVGELIEPWMGYVDGDDTVTLLAAWCEGKAFALTDAEVAEVEEWIAGELAK